MTATATELPTTLVEELIARIDEHLASIPPGRNLISTDEHTDMLLDVRLIAAKGRTIEPAEHAQPAPTGLDGLTDEIVNDVDDAFGPMAGVVVPDDLDGLDTIPGVESRDDDFA